jgi:hypothetical protein
MKRSKKIVFAIALSVGLVAATVALGDNVKNDLDATVDSTFEVLAQNVGGPDSTVGLALVPTNGDGKNGCNLQGGESITFNVTSSVPGVATVSPGTVSFGAGCGATPTLTVHPVSAGSSNITLTEASRVGAAGTTFGLDTAGFKVNVAPPANTAPVVAVTGVSNGGSYSKGAVPAAGCSVTDTEDGTPSVSPVLSTISGPYAADGIGQQTATCTYTDAGGLTETASATYAIVDSSAPVISYVLTPPTPASGWHTTDVSLVWTVSEPDSPGSLVKTGCVDQVITADQAEQTYSCGATSAGGSSGSVDVSIKRDASAPNAPTASIVPAPNGAGWSNTDVVVHFADTGDVGPSGVASCTADVPVTGETVGTPVSGSCTDNAGNVSTATSVTVKIDQSDPNPPAVTVNPTPNGAGWNNSDVTVSFAPNGDNGPSGVADCSDDVIVSTETTVTGQLVSGTCTDAADNTSESAGTTIKLDKTAPTSVVTGFTEGQEFILGSEPTPGCSASDNLSGVVSHGTPSVSGGPGVGLKSVTCNGATDVAGNTQTTPSPAKTYRVIYNWRGFFQPVDNLPALNVVQAGRAIPVKFSLGGNHGLSIFAANSPTSLPSTCTTAGAPDEVESTLTAGGSSLSYDATADQYNYVWKTEKSWAGTCRTLTVKLIDGTVHQALFQLKK